MYIIVEGYQWIEGEVSYPDRPPGGLVGGVDS